MAAAAALAAAAFGLSAAPASAVSGNGLRTMDFYAYAEAGETVAVSFADVTNVTVVQPDGTEVFTCSTQPCTYAGTAPMSGVWLVRYVEDSDNVAAWSVTVRDAASVPIPGRVWAEQYTISNTGFSARTFTATYLSEFGVQYRSQFTGHVGWVFRISASNRGVMFNDGSCLSAYRSVPEADMVEAANPPLAAMNGDDYTTVGDCADKGLVRYRIFLGEAPAPDMPASTANWADGRTTQQWVLPAYQNPTIDDLAFSRAVGGLGGTITGTLTGQSGTVRVLLDFDGDGTADPEDRVFDVATGVGSFSVNWDGLDGLGEPVPASTGFRVFVELTAEAEIHFLESDVEGRTGGIQVTRLNGPGAEDSRLSWNDSYLPAARATTTSPLSADRVDSTGGVHAWGFNGNGWGNGRIIDDWMYIYPSANAEIIVAADPDASGEPALALTGASSGGAAAAVAGAMLLLGAAVVSTRRRTRRRPA